MRIVVESSGVFYLYFGSEGEIKEKVPTRRVQKGNNGEVSGVQYNER
jgi:hypothetical protein